MWLVKAAQERRWRLHNEAKFFEDVKGFSGGDSYTDYYLSRDRRLREYEGANAMGDGPLVVIEGPEKTRRAVDAHEASRYKRYPALVVHKHAFGWFDWQGNRFWAETVNGITQIEAEGPGEPDPSWGPDPVDSVWDWVQRRNF